MWLQSTEASTGVLESTPEPMLTGVLDNSASEEGWPQRYPCIFRPQAQAGLWVQQTHAVTGMLTRKSSSLAG